MKSNYIKYWAIIYSLILIVFFTSGLKVQAENIPSYTDIKGAIETAYLTRSDFLLNAKGIANITLSREETSPGKAKTIEEDISNKLGFSQDSFKTSGNGIWSVEWYQKGSKRRYDIEVPSSEESSIERPFLLPQKKNFAIDPEKSIYYDILGENAYINKSPREMANPLSLLNNFDISKLYKFSDCSLPELFYRLDNIDKTEWQYQITEDKIEATHCIKIEIVVKKMARYNFWIVPELSYSLIKGQLFLTIQGVEKLAESYEAKYEKSKSEEIWLLSDLKVEYNQDRSFNEKMEVQLTNTEIGIEIPDETFTFEGLGVPLGTKVLDKSLGGQPLEYYYGSFPIGKVDNFAENILKQQNDKKQENVLEETVEEQLPVEVQSNTDSIEKNTLGAINSDPKKGYLWILFGTLIISGIVVISFFMRKTNISTKIKE
ncbi:MAG: hypothetical protein JXA96_11150 [Sedimentisphaerales bacterium]|nr:hypothetical protein [Sedimentisphaerales bacterium]